MPKRIKVVETARSEAPLYMKKAQQFLEEARDAHRSGRNDATLLNAVHAAIAACDAVTVALSGRRSTDPDHQRATDLLEETLAGGKTQAPIAQLRMLLAKKSAVEYDSRQAGAREADEGLKRAERFILWASTIVDKH